MAKWGRTLTWAVVQVDGMSLGQVNYGLNWLALRRSLLAILILLVGCIIKEMKGGKDED